MSKFIRLNTKNFITLILKSNKKRLLLYELIWIDSEKVFDEIGSLIDLSNKKILLLGFEPFLALKIAEKAKELTIVDDDINLIEATREFLNEIWEKDNVEIYYEDYIKFLYNLKDRYDLIIFIVKPRIKPIFFSRKFYLLLKEKSDCVIINNDKPPLKKKVLDYRTDKIIKKLYELKEKNKIKKIKQINNTILFC